MTWKPQPNPGDMKLCGDCRHRREDPRRDYRCALTSHKPHLPPLVELRSGREICSFFESLSAPAIAGEQLELEAS